MKNYNFGCYFMLGVKLHLSTEEHRLRVMQNIFNPSAGETKTRQATYV